MSGQPTSDGAGASPAPWQPDYAIPPGTILQLELTQREITQAELASRAGLSPKHVNQVIKGVVPLSAEMALALERVLGTPSHVWNGLEAAYRGAAVKSRSRAALADHSSWASRFPIAALVRHGILDRSDGVADRAEKILTFFGVASPEVYRRLWDEPVVAFRRSEHIAPDPYATAAWLRMAELAARTVDRGSFDPQAFRQLLARARALTRTPLSLAFPELQSRCSAAGVVVVRVPEIRGARACGATRWIDSRYPIIVLTGRYNVEDSLWFSFFHESGHVLLHPRKTTYIKPEDAGGGAAEEREADEFARSALIPTEFVEELATLRSDAEIATFAARIGVDQGIVAGRLMADGVRRWSPRLRRKIVS